MGRDFDDFQTHMSSTVPLIYPHPSPATPFYFSNTFQCFTTPPFYRSLLLELEFVSNKIDQCKPTAREQVWKHLFTLVGGRADASCSQLFTPILTSWINSPTINLLAVELLYLAFAVAFDRVPNLLGTNYPVPFGTSIQIHPFKPPHVLRPNVTQPTAIPNLPKPSPRTIQAKPPSSAPAPDASPQPSKPQNQPEPAPKQKQTSPAQPNDVIHKLIELQKWKEELDQLPEVTKNKIWRVWKGLMDELPPLLDESSFTRTINIWGQNLQQHMISITNIHSVINFLGLVPDLVSRTEQPADHKRKPSGQDHFTPNKKSKTT